MDLPWLEHVNNPYSVLALIALILGASIHLYVPEISKKRPAFLKASYILFIFAALCIVASVVAVSFLLAGVGARDMQTQHVLPRLLQVAQAHEYDGETVGWVWFGETDESGGLKTETVEPAAVPQVEDEYVTIRDVHLRNLPPKFSWWKFRYVLGDSLMKLHVGEKLRVLNTHEVGGELWAVVFVIPE